MVRAIFDELGYAFVAIMERTGDPRGAALASLVSLDCEAAALAPSLDPGLERSLRDDARRLERDGTSMGIESGPPLATALRNALKLSTLANSR